MPSRLSGLFPPTPPSPRAPSTTTDAPSTTTTPASSTSRPAPGPSPAEVPTAHIAAMPPRATPAPPAPRTGLSPLGARFVAAEAIVQILLGGQVTRDIPGDTRDGVGMLDPVKAVAAAAAWRPAPAG